MKKKRFFSILKIVYAIVMICIFTAMILSFTSKGTNKVVIFGRRFLCSFIFSVIGGYHLLFAERVAKFFYANNDINVFKGDEGRQKSIHQVKYFGICTFITGIVILSLSIVLFSIL